MKCAHLMEQQICSWYIHIIKKATHGQWQIIAYNAKHTCIERVIGNNHQNLTVVYIVKNILHIVWADLETYVSRIIEEVQVNFFFSFLLFFSVYFSFK